VPKIETPLSDQAAMPRNISLVRRLDFVDCAAASDKSVLLLLRGDAHTVSCGESLMVVANT
jgi:hypothetical protein